MSNYTSRRDIDNYLIKHTIGHGSTCTVYFANEISTGRAVAIKILDRADNNPDNLQLFKREIRHLSSLNHPNIIQLIESGVTNNNKTFAAYQYIHGQTLKDYIRSKRKLPIIETIDIMKQVLDALSTIHSKKIIHNDIKPQNILISTNSLRPHVYLIDFAASSDIKTALLKNNPRFTPAYAAPEQLPSSTETKPEQTSTSTDIYAWALVFIECLTGKPVFSDSNIENLIHIRTNNQAISIPKQLTMHPLGEILTSCTVYNRKNRARSCKDIYNKLQLCNINNLEPVIADEGIATINNLKLDFTSQETIDETQITDKISNEQRQIAILYCNIEIAPKQQNKISKQTLNNLISYCKDFAGSIYSQFNAYLAFDFSNTFVLYFGYPITLEQNTKHAALTAKELISAFENRVDFSHISNQLDKDSIKLKIGIHTETLTINHGHPPEDYAAYKASLLPLHSDDNKITLSETSNELLSDYFHTSEKTLLIKHLKAFTLGQEKNNQPSPFQNTTYGRSEHLRKIKKILAEKQSNKTLIQIEGEPGIGKSHLISSLIDSEKAHDNKTLAFKCSQENSNDTLYPFKYLLNAQLKLTGFTSHENKVDTLKKHLQNLDLDINETLPVILTWLGIPLPPDMHFSQYSHEKQKSILKSYLEQLFYILSENKTLLLFIEDTHWADLSTLEFLNQNLQLDTGKRLCIITTTRPINSTAGSNNCDSHWFKITLDRLSKSESKKLVNDISSEIKLPANIIRIIISRAEGIPLYIKHLSLMIVDLIKNNKDIIIPEKSIPFSLKDTLYARLNLLGKSKLLAQYASTLGQEFELSLLKEISRFTQQELSIHIQLLSEASIIVFDSNQNYKFSHSLIHQAVYDSILEEEKKSTHRKIARHIVSHSDAPTSHAESIIHHAFHADMFDTVVKYSLLAARQAINRTDTEIAITHCEKSLQALEKTSLYDKYNANRLEILSLKAYALVSLKGYSNQDVKKAYEQAYSLITDKTDSLTSGAVIYGLFSYYAARAEYTTALTYATDLLNLAQQSNDNRLLLVAYNSMGLTALLKGQFELAKQHLELAIKQGNSLGKQSILLDFGGDFRGYARSWMIILQSLLGKKDQAIELCDQALQICCENKLTYAFILAFTDIGQFYNDIEYAIKSSDSLIKTSEKYGLDFFNMIGLLQKGWISSQTGAEQKGIELISNSINMMEHASLYSFLPRYYSLLAEANIKQKDYQSANKNIDTALNLCKKSRGNFYLSEVYRLKALITYSINENNYNTVRYLTLSYTHAKRQNALLWLTRTTDTIKTLYSQHNKDHNPSFKLKNLINEVL